MRVVWLWSQGTSSGSRTFRRSSLRLTRSTMNRRSRQRSTYRTPPPRHRARRHPRTWRLRARCSPAGPPARHDAAPRLERKALMTDTQQETKQQRGSRKVRLGRVVSDKMDKTIVVQVTDRKSHPLYKKVIQHRVRFKAHDDGNECTVGDLVRIMEVRPLSRDKRWRLVEVVEKAR